MRVCIKINRKGSARLLSTAFISVRAVTLLKRYIRINNTHPTRNPCISDIIPGYNMLRIPAPQTGLYAR